MNPKLENMKNRQVPLLGFLFALISLVCACHQDGSTGNSGNPPTGGSSSSYEAELVGNQMVIRWLNLTLDSAARQLVRDSMEIEYHFDILGIEECDCQNTALELWTLDTTDGDFIGVEGTLALMDQSGEGDVEGDLQFTFMVDSVAPIVNGAQGYGQFVNHSGGDAVRIAVVDTGLEYDFLSTAVLYNSRDNSCQEQVSGWDYTEDNWDPRDLNGHGTVVTQIIMDELDEVGIPYEIVPVRAFDRHGKGSYFDVLCAISYIGRYSPVNLVNFSFGWRGMEQNTLMNALIEEMSSQVLFIASAGNEGMDTDHAEQAHFPSGYPAENLLSVAGFSGTPLFDPASHSVTGIQLHQQSNYGPASIDVVAPYDLYTVNLASQSGQYQETPAGTSYASAFVTARAAVALFSDADLTPVALKDVVISSGYNSPGFDDYCSSGLVFPREMNQMQ